jgi:hypothetical protein
MTTRAEWLVLDYLSKEDWSQEGECYGAALDALKTRGLVLQVPSTQSHRSRHFDLVRLTGCGWIEFYLYRAQHAEPQSTR